MVTYDSDKEGAREEALQEAEEEGLYTGGTDVEVTDGDNDNNSSSSDSTTVVVPESPAERDRLQEQEGDYTLGQGSTNEQALEDAADNPSFDADQDTELGQEERQQDTNQPLQNVENSRPEEIQDAAQEIAGSERFRGERTGRQAGQLAQAIEQGQREFGDVDIQTDQGRIQVLGRSQTNTENRSVGDRLTNPQRGNSQRPFPEYTDIGTLVDPRKGNPNATLAEELTTAGVDLMEKGQNLGQNLRREAEKQNAFNVITKSYTENLGSGFNVLKTPSNVDSAFEKTTEVLQDQEIITDEQARNADQGVIPETVEERAQESQRSVAGNIVEGAGTVGTQVTGLGVSSIGAIPRASATTTQNVLDVEEENREIAKSSETGLVEGSAKGFTLTADKVAEDPVGFVSQEAGEEVSEAIVFGGLTGGAGLAVSAVPTPEFDVTPSLQTRKGSTRGIPGVPSDQGPATTPGPQSQTNPTTQTDTLAGVETDLDVSTTTETETTLQNQFVESSRAGSPSLEDTISRPESTTQPQSDVLTRPESEIIGEVDPRTETKAEPQSEPRVEADILAEPRTEPEPRLEIKNELVPELNRRPDADLGQEEQEDESNGVLDGLVGDQKGFKRTVSVGADILGIESSNKQESQQSAGNPLNLRPELN